MEEEVEMLRNKIEELEKKIALREDKNVIKEEKLGSASEPTEPKKADYDYVEGWKIIDLKMMNEALEIAQKCGHSQVVLVEVNKKTMRSGLAAHLAYVCITCGRQTIFSSSTFSQEDPPNYMVNKEFSAIGMKAYNSMVRLVQEDKTTIPVPKDTKMLNRKPTFCFKFENSEMENIGGETEHVDVDCPPVIKKEPVIKDEPEDYIEDYLEPSISITEGEASNYDEDIRDNVKEEMDAVDPIQDPTDGPQIDVSTITTNTPFLAMSTVKPNTEVLGGSVTPWAPHLLIKVHPSLFIRTTCSKIMLPPGLYSYQRNNGIKSIMSVKADSGTFDSIESHYHMCKPTNFESETGKKVDNRRWNTKVKKTYTSAHRKTPLQIFSMDIKTTLSKEGIPKEDWDKETIDRWARLDPVTKEEYKDRALNPGGQPPEPQEHTPGEKKKSTNIPLPALKKFAAEVAPGLKKRKPYLAKIENRGQLNKHLLEMWLELSQGEQMSYKLLAGMSVEESPDHESQAEQKDEAVEKPESDFTTPTRSKRRKLL